MESTFIKTSAQNLINPRNKYKIKNAMCYIGEKLM